MPSAVFLTVIGLAAGWIAGFLLPKSYREEPLPQPLIVCPACREPLSASALIPGFVLKCPSCGTRPWIRPALMAPASAALFLACYAEFDEAGAALLGGVFCLTLLSLTFTDLESRLLPNRIVFPAAVFTIATGWLLPDFSALDSTLGLAVAIMIAVIFLGLSLLFGGGALGLGDIKVILMMGPFLGPAGILLAVLIATFAAAAFALLALISRRVRLGDYIAHGPFLALGGVVGLLWGGEIWDWYAE
jgi:prepilin signal peptidase PulO-like enzyme (type II secretory pathway)